MYKRIDLGNGKYTLVDKELADDLNKIKWFCGKDYAVRTDNKNYKQIRMHSQIMKCPRGFSVDHINGNTLDNRKCNLRICKQSDNSKNKKITVDKSSMFKGVDRWNNRWRAQISNAGIKIYLGMFDTEEQASYAYKIASAKYHGEFGRHEDTKLDVVNFNDYTILERPVTIATIPTYEVICSNGITYTTIQEAALALDVKDNTIVKACTDKKKHRRVRGYDVKYGNVTYYTVIIE